MPGKTTELENLEANIAEVLLMVQISSASFDDGVVNDELEKMARAFAAGAYSNSPPLPLTTLLVQDHKGISNVAPPADAQLCSISIPKAESETGLQEANDVGEARIHDYISNLQFLISPTTFFLEVEFGTGTYIQVRASPGISEFGDARLLGSRWM